MILCCGEALIDFIPTPDGEAYQPCPGGSILNIAVGLGRMQVPVGFLSRLSYDIFGDQLAQHLISNGVTLDHCPRVAGQTTLAFVKLSQDDNAEPEYAFYAEGAVDRVMQVSDLPHTLDEAQALHFGSISLLLEPGATALESLMLRESRKKVISLDPNVRPTLIDDQAAYRERFEKWVAAVDILRLSTVDFDFIYPNANFEEMLPRWFGGGLSLAILTRGEEGALGYLPDGTTAGAKPPKITVADTVGAGDTFLSAALTYLYEHQLLDARSNISGMGAAHLSDCLTFAVKAAAINCTRKGANPPTRSEMDAAL
jgi:fructokinase